MTLPMIGKRPGHTQVQTTQRYAYLLDDWRAHPWIKYPTPDTKIEGTGGAAATYAPLKDLPGSVCVVTGPSGTSALASRYAPYGAQTPTQTSTATQEDHAFIGERQSSIWGAKFQANPHSFAACDRLEHKTNISPVFLWNHVPFL